MHMYTFKQSINYEKVIVKSLCTSKPLNIVLTIASLYISVH